MFKVQFKYFLFFIAFISTSSYSQSPGFQWVHGMGGTDMENGRAVVTDALGNVYTTGDFKFTVDFDPGPGVFNLISLGSQSSMYISKFDASGNFVWAKAINSAGPTSGQAVGNAIAVDAGYIYLTGYFNGTVNFNGLGGSPLTSAGNNDIFILRFDLSGGFAGVKGIGGTGAEQGLSIAVASSNVYVTGYFNGAVDFNPGGTPNILTAGGSDVFICKYNFVSNTFNWTKQMGGPLAEFGYGIIVDAAGNIYTTGTFTGTADFDPHLTGTYYLTTGTSSTDVFISKLNASGNFVWAKSFGGANLSDYGYGIALDAFGNIFTSGGFNGANVDFDPGVGTYPLTSSGFDIYISKFDTTGNFNWAKAVGGSGSDVSYGVATDVDGSVYATGLFYNTVDFDPNAGIFNLSAVGASNDIFILKLDSVGNFSWANAMGGSSFDYSNAISMDANHNVYVTGNFYGPLDFDIDSCSTHSLSSIGMSDVFVVKINQETPPVSICMSTVDSVNSLFVDLIWDKTGLTGVDSFRIYREIGSEFRRIGSVPFTALSIFTDNTNGINPQSGSYKYKISAFYTGGVESLLSVTHETMWMQVSPGTGPAINLTWTDYCGFPVDSYKVFRDSLYSTNYNDWELIKTVAWGTNTYIDLLPPQGSPRYRIIAYTALGCTTTIKNNVPMSTSVKGSKSNTDDKTHNPVSINEQLTDNWLNVSPNPSQGTFNVWSPRYQMARIEIYNMFGALLYSKKMSSAHEEIVIPEMPNGIYSLQVTTEMGTTNRKIVISR